MTTVRQYDDEIATIRWRRCDSTAEWVKFLPGTTASYPGKDGVPNVYFRYRKYLYFPMSATPGVVMVKTCSDGEETSFCLLKNECFRFTNTDRLVPILAA
ncbi:hypothetical protein DPMN_054695 [Dreissena polymorpha]|uniref:Uncharacterized protein n=1 Tax=Dreissena polymorpha TaxID=45954 RepID=A0A9D4CNK7_DREPO|nr:hypothetical protein DPMN_054695 [Dreissena polymorpha]